MAHVIYFSQEFLSAGLLCMNVQVTNFYAIVPLYIHANNLLLQPSLVLVRPIEYPEKKQKN